MIFGAVTLACLLAAMTLSLHGHHPLLMVPIAVACAVVFVRNGDGREHAPVASTAARDSASASEATRSIP